MSKKLILDDKQIRQKIKRMAYEIYEANYNAKELVILGIKDQGLILAKALQRELKEIFPIKYTLIEADPDKSKPETYNPDLQEFQKIVKGNNLIVVDDVLNSGRTVMLVIRHFLALNPKSVQVAVLIDRDHKSFPLKSDYTGLGLATTIQEHVSVDLNKKGAFSASLN